MYIHETKSSNHNAVANKIGQRRGGQTSPKAFVDRRSSNESQRALRRVMVCQPTIQMNKKLNDIIYYGHDNVRKPYMLGNGLNRSNAHCTVDSLNEAIGLTNNSMNGPMGSKRKVIYDAIDQKDRGLSKDEKAWTQWLRARKNVLLMPEMTGEQCRHDLNLYRLTDSFYNRWAPSFLTFGSAFVNDADRKKSIPNFKHGNEQNHKTWTAENHSVNVAGRTPKKQIWTPTQIDAHDNFVASDNTKYIECCNKLNESFGFTVGGKDSPIFTLTDKWLSEEVMHRFWRLTSLMGLDFFVQKGKNIVFVREENQKSHFDAEGRKSITDSEWEHAKRLKYVKSRSNPNGLVKRVDPVRQPASTTSAPNP